jgi:hypothetical protein
MVEVLANLSRATRRLRRRPRRHRGDLFDCYRGGAIAVIAFGARIPTVARGTPADRRRDYD